jgi:hypothetical protein
LSVHFNSEKKNLSFLKYFRSLGSFLMKTALPAYSRNDQHTMEAEHLRVEVAAPGVLL